MFWSSGDTTLAKTAGVYPRKEGRSIADEGFKVIVDVRIRGIEEITALLRELVSCNRDNCQRQPHLTGGKFVILVKATNPDVNYDISGVTAEDDEGDPIPDAALVYEVTSTDDTIVSVTPDATDPTKGSAHFGAPGIATVNVQVKTGETLLGSFAQSFTVTAGDPTKIVGGTITFDGLADTP